jgi:hypothetical protein
MPISVNPHLLDGRKWFAIHPEFHTSGKEDLWHCGGFFIEWNKGERKWTAWTQKNPKRHTEPTAFGALMAVGWQEPIERVLDATRDVAGR